MKTSGSLCMKTLPLLLVAVLALCENTLPAQAQEGSAFPYNQKMDVVYGEVHGTGLLMDVFTPLGKTNG